ncbi:BTB/POZ and MATH domain-containing protein 1 [Dichanthelium oligosanthes]|uniref:BTB/POZ and MATH domain-containing protein 1 n=1 Tax=Dichanthelium oligosanthes TaxID=888268 RepID=A0A1E5UZ38_9POAL|nr:BTB/POZ and MATH domain-containing protein 1 [Dichanthelium oligosanthes]
MPRHRPTPTTVSTCMVDTEQGKHVFEIFDYSQHRGMGTGEYIRSGIFSVGGYDWDIRFYPDGLDEVRKDYISVYLELQSKDTKVRASCDLMLVDQKTNLSTSVRKTELRKFDSSNATRFAPQDAMFMKRSKFEASMYLHEDHLTIQCIVTVKKDPHVSKTELFREIEVSPSNITAQLGNLLDSKEVTDVTFSVGGETFAAHRILLATRSPVFKAQLYGSMREAKEQLVIVEDMQPAVFRALLRFIYTDSLPDMDDLEGDANSEMIKHLLVAADRYAVDRLNLVCQSILCKNLDVETVSATLALAYKHNCDTLKDICLEFITSPNVMDAVVATEGFKNLKATCPSAIVDAFVKSTRFHKA